MYTTNTALLIAVSYPTIMAFNLPSDKAVQSCSIHATVSFDIDHSPHKRSYKKKSKKKNQESHTLKSTRYYYWTKVQVYSYYYYGGPE